MIKGKRILGVDYGDARTGVAVSDMTGLLATGVTVVKAAGMRKTAGAVAEEAKRQGAEKIIVGYPLNMDGSEGPRGEKARAFSEMLHELTGLPVELWDERLTTIEAYEIMDATGTRGKRRRERVDMLAAELILSDYLNAKKKGGDAK